MNRYEALNLFLKQNGWGNATQSFLASDASFRSYTRLSNGLKTAVLMDAPPPENPAQYIYIDKVLSQMNVRVPKIYASDLTNGFVLLEDFGNNTFSKIITGSNRAFDLYKMATENLIKLQNNVSETDIPLYDFNKMLFEVSLLPDWFCQYTLQQPLSADAKDDFIKIWEPLIKKIQSLPTSLVLLDYHTDNLMLTPDGKCGVIDFQDARTGPILYDLVSLLEDERRPVPDNIRHEMTDLYFNQNPHLDRAEIKNLLPLVAVQRHTKVIGIFVRLCVRDKKDKYLKMIPFIWSLIEKHLENPVFADYKIWLDTYIPRKNRQEIIIQRGIS